MIEGKILERYRADALEWVAEQMPGGFFVYRSDEAQELIYINKAVCRIFGCETEEEFRKLTGNTFPGMVHPNDRRRVLSSIDRQIADEKNHNMDKVEYRIIRRDGSIRYNGGEACEGSRGGKSRKDGFPDKYVS